MFAKTQHLPEKAKCAVEKLEAVFPFIRPHTLSYTFPTFADLCTEEQVFFVARRVIVSQIPIEDGWQWQLIDGCYKTYDSTGCMNVLFYPVVLRGHFQGSSAYPEVRVWIFNISVPEIEREVTVLWSQKGVTPEMLDGVAPVCDVDLTEPAWGVSPYLSVPASIE